MKYKTIYTYLIIGFISTLFFSCLTKTNLTHKTSLNNPDIQLLWETETILSDIESAIYDKKNDIIYTSSINGNWLKKGGVNAADIHYIPSKNILLVPAMLKHKLMAYKLINNN